LRAAGLRAATLRAAGLRAAVLRAAGFFDLTARRAGAFFTDFAITSLPLGSNHFERKKIMIKFDEFVDREIRFCRRILSQSGKSVA
jgi:hypothetical protein